MSHGCHANAATANKVCGAEAHPAMPFCKRHAQMLPGPHKKRIWEERRRDRGYDPCGLCDPSVGDDAGLRRSKDWDMLVYLAIAMLLLLEFGGMEKEGHCQCGAPSDLSDESGFCWGCGVLGAPKLYVLARKALKKYNLPVRS